MITSVLIRLPNEVLAAGDIVETAETVLVVNELLIYKTQLAATGYLILWNVTVPPAIANLGYDQWQYVNDTLSLKPYVESEYMKEQRRIMLRTEIEALEKDSLMVRGSREFTLLLLGREVSLSAGLTIYKTNLEALDAQIAAKRAALIAIV